MVVEDGDGVSRVAVHLIELPRLKLTLQPRESSDGTVRLHLVDHSGWFVSDRYAEGADLGQGERKRMRELLAGLQNSIVLENLSEEVQVST